MKKLLVLLLFQAALIPCALHAQTFNLETQREPVVSLDGLWRFHTGDNPAWASPTFNDSHWPLIRSDEGWSNQGYPGYSGYAWYRFKLQVPDGNKPLSLLLMDILTSYRVYADGKLIGGLGYMPPHHLSAEGAPEVYDLPHANEPGLRTILIAIRVWHDPVWASYVPGGSVSPGSVAGDSTLIHERLDLINLFDPNRLANLYTYSILAALFGLLVLVLFFLRPADREYLWFAVVLLASAADTAAQIIDGVSRIPVEMFDLFDGCLTALFTIAALLFFSRVLRARRRFWWWFAVCAASLASCTVFLYWSGWTSVPIAGAFEVFCLLPSQFWILVVLMRGAARKDADSRLLLFPVLLMFGYFVLDNFFGIAYQLGWQRIGFYLNPALFHIPFPVTLQDVVNTVFAFAMMAFLIRRFSLARREEERLSREFEAAHNVQTLLIPSNPPATPGFSVETVYLPATEVGGDFFHIQPGKDGSLLIVSGDVSGKGLKAAMTVSAIIGALRNEPCRQPATVLANLNRILHGHITGFATCTAALIRADGSLTLANAGNLAPYLNGKELAIEPGLPLGILADTTYAETTHHLNPGDRLTFVSDGVVEATNPQRELFGFDRTQSISTQPAAAIASAAQTHGQQDDISVIAITMHPQAAVVTA
ncbi:MAG TPA: SpoIIE family protein phosphatase [Acidobacteriaceae bacterium]|nr:SpoIIE family protein phosphatase [Acidobacteriaceae bacterium]